MGVHCIRTRAPALVSVWQDSLPGSEPEGAGAGPLCVTGTIGADRRGADALGAPPAPLRAISRGARGRVEADGSGGDGKVATAAGSSLWRTIGSGSVLGCQGVQLVRRTKASRVGLVMPSADGIDCMHPDNARAAQHRPARFVIDSIIAHSVVDRSRARKCRATPLRQVNPDLASQFPGLWSEQLQGARPVERAQRHHALTKPGLINGVMTLRYVFWSCSDTARFCRLPAAFGRA